MCLFIVKMFVEFADKTRGSITFQKEGSCDVQQIANIVLNKVLFSSTVQGSSDLGLGCNKLHTFIICDVLRDLVQFVQFTKREKFSWRSVTLSKVAG